MSPEQRAKALVPEVSGEDYHVPAFRALIATAIREAEDAAYERAAEHMESMWKQGKTINLRSLKSQEP